MRFVQCKFDPRDRRAWAYENTAGFDLARGDRVEVDTPKGGRATVIVVSVSDVDPGFKCKPILRIIAQAPRNDAPAEAG